MNKSVITHYRTLIIAAVISFLIAIIGIAALVTLYQTHRDESGTAVMAEGIDVAGGRKK